MLKSGQVLLKMSKKLAFLEYLRRFQQMEGSLKKKFKYFV